MEELVAAIPESVRYLLRKGIQAVVCGEPLWGTLEAVARDKGLTDADISQMLAELSRLNPPA
jgi:hypothetical protein